MKAIKTPRGTARKLKREAARNAALDAIIEGKKQPTIRIKKSRKVAEPA